MRAGIHTIRRCGAVLLWLIVSSTVLGEAGWQWPTPHPGFARGDAWQTWAQATASGLPQSALFGCVRNDGRRFHEGIDIAPYRKRRGGEATDPVYAALAGTVVHINTVVGHSSYGRYVVIEHRQLRLPVYTLYAHLASVERRLALGDTVQAGARIGVMGRSAGGYSIPQSRAHLHFEIGLRLGDGFDAWYAGQGFGSPNHHGLFNGMNLVGLDPKAFLEWAQGGGKVEPLQYLAQIAPGAVLQIRSAAVPELVRRAPLLWSRGVPLSDTEGWEIIVSAWGFPLAFRSLSAAETVGLQHEGAVRVVAADWQQVDEFACKALVKKTGGGAQLTAAGQRLVELIFK